jgi:fumarate reductase subunit C
VTGRPVYTEYHPRWLRPRMSVYWWLGRWAYVKFILRELSSLAVAWFVVVLVLLFRAMGAGAAAYERFLTWSAHPLVIAINVVTLFFLVVHAVTWFNLAPKAMVAHVGKKRVPGVVIAASNYAAWIVVSAGLAWFLAER